MLCKTMIIEIATTIRIIITKDRNTQNNNNNLNGSGNNANKDGNENYGDTDKHEA